MFLGLAAAGALVAGAEPQSSLTLESAVAAALAHAPAVEAADAEVDAASGRVVQARSARRPSAVISGSLGAGWLDPRGFFGLQGESTMPGAVQIMAEQPLFTGGRAESVLSQARAGREIAAAAREAARGNLASAVAEAYGAILAAEEHRRLYERLVEELVEIERQAQLRFRAGESPRTDISQAAARLAEAQAALAQAEEDIVSAGARLRALTGIAADSLAPLPPPPPTPANFADAIAAAQSSSPTVLRAEAALDAARAGSRAARAERRPTVSAFAEASTIRDQFFPDYRADGATVGVRARWQLYDGGRTGGRIAEAGAEERAAEAHLRQARSESEEQVTRTFQALRTSELVERAKTEQQRAAEEALHNVRLEVRAGMKAQLDLLDAEREAAAAGAELASARATRVATAYRLNALLGRY